MCDQTGESPLIVGVNGGDRLWDKATGKIYAKVFNRRPVGRCVVARSRLLSRPTIFKKSGGRESNRCPARMAMGQPLEAVLVKRIADSFHGAVSEK